MRSKQDDAGMKIAQTPYFPYNAEENSFTSTAAGGKFAGIRLYKEWLELMWTVPKRAKRARLEFYDGPTGSTFPLKCVSGDMYYCKIEYPDGWEDTYLGTRFGKLIAGVFRESKAKMIYIELAWTSR